MAVVLAAMPGATGAFLDTQMTWTTVIGANQSCTAPESLPPFLCFGFVLPAFNLRDSNIFFISSSFLFFLFLF